MGTIVSIILQVCENLIRITIYKPFVCDTNKPYMMSLEGYGSWGGKSWDTTEGLNNSSTI